MDVRATFFDRVSGAIRQASPDYLKSSLPDRALIDMSRGEVRIDWPSDVLAALPGPDGHDLRYQDPRGHTQLRKAFLELSAAGDANALSSRNILVTAGAKQALWLAFASTVSPGDRVLLPQPGWAPYVVWTRTFGAQAMYYDPCDLSAGGLLAAIKSRGCDHIVVNSPHNPTGTEFSQAVIDQIAAAAAQAGVTLISDEVYREFGDHRSTFLAHVGSRASVLVVDSVSKVAAAAGLRIGFLVGAEQAIDAALTVRSTVDSCPAGPSQAIARFLLSPAAGAFRQGVRDFARSCLARLTKRLKEEGHRIESVGGLYVWVATTADSDRIQLAPGLFGVGVAGRTFGRASHLRLCPVDASEPVLALLGVPRPTLAIGQ